METVMLYDVNESETVKSYSEKFKVVEHYTYKVGAVVVLVLYLLSA